MNARPQALLLDIQGVLVDNGVALDGAVDTVLKARCRRGLPIRLVTNTATRHHKQLLQELRTLGFALEAEELFTAPLAALSWLQRHQLRPLALVHPAIAPLFWGLGIDENADQGRGRTDCVLLGDARDQLSYANLNRAQSPLPSRRPLDAGCRGVSAGPGIWGRL